MTSEEIGWALYFIKEPNRLDTVKRLMKVVKQGDEKVKERIKEIHEAANSFQEIHIARCIEEHLLLIQKIYNQNGGKF